MGCVQVKPKKGNMQNKTKEELMDYEKTATPYDPEKKEVQYNVIANGVYFDALNSQD